MNGIAGIVRIDGGAIEPRELEASMRAMEIAQPRIAVCGSAAFACDEAPQAIWPPVVKVSGGRMIAADARVDDRDALGARLGLSRDQASATEDADLLLESHARWGAGCVDHLCGDFAFAIWDPHGRSLFAARDHAGARALYYASHAGRLVFASSIPGVLAFDGVRAEIDEAEIARFLLSETRGYFDPEHTFFSGVRKLAFGHRLRADAGGVTVERYWHPERLAPVVLPTGADYARRLRALVEAAIDDRLRGVTHAATHLSGGLDTTALAVLMQRHAAAHGRRVTAFSWSPGPSDLRGSEHDRIEDVARAEGLTLAYAPIRMPERWRFDADVSLWPRITYDTERPVVEAAARAGAPVIVSGWGGDEAASFLGGGIAAADLARGRWLHLLRYCSGRAALAGPSPSTVFWREAVVPWLPDALRRARRRRASGGPLLVNPDLLRRVRGRMRPPVIAIRDRRSGHATMMQRYYGGWMTGRLESWSRFRATHHVTHAYPLTDRRVLEFVYGSPERLHVRGGLRRALFYDAMEGVVPRGPQWHTPKRDDARAAMIARYSNAGDRARILRDLDRVPQRHPWIDLDRLRGAVRATPDSAPLPESAEHALQALVIWRRWCVPVDTTA